MIFHFCFHLMNLTFSILFYLLGGLFKCGSGSATLLLIYSIFINFNFIVWISSDPEPDPEPDPNKANKFLEPDPNTVPGVLVLVLKSQSFSNMEKFYKIRWSKKIYNNNKIPIILVCQNKAASWPQFNELMLYPLINFPYYLFWFCQFFQVPGRRRHEPHDSLPNLQVQRLS